MTISPVASYLGREEARLSRASELEDVSVSNTSEVEEVKVSARALVAACPCDVPIAAAVAVSADVPKTAPLDRKSPFERPKRSPLFAAPNAAPVATPAPEVTPVATAAAFLGPARFTRRSHTSVDKFEVSPEKLSGGSRARVSRTFAKRRSGGSCCTTLRRMRALRLPLIRLAAVRATPKTPVGCFAFPSSSSLSSLNFVGIADCEDVSSLKSLKLRYGLVRSPNSLTALSKRLLSEVLPALFIACIRRFLKARGGSCCTSSRAVRRRVSSSQCLTTSRASAG
mmetsp:Transcript_58766/g.80167  ORF Transcript_58766/g.80167 Transcript_58766/m.80167 type:complete len:283 (+) Transcript_58766:464-1312(+)